MLTQKVREVVEELKNSKEYKKWKQAMANLEGDRQLKLEVERFLAESAELCQQSGGGTGARRREMDETFNTLIQIPAAAAYFKAGQEFDLQVMQMYQMLDDLIAQALKKP
jgi:hypothetical protein